MRKDEKLVFWMITPPNNMEAFIHAVVKRWHGSVILVACHNLREERKLSGFSDSFDWLDEYYVLDGIPDSSTFIRSFIENHKDAIHVFSGLRREPANYMYRIRKWYPNAKIVAITEKPAPNSGNKMVRFLKKASFPLFYRILLKKAARTVDILFVCSLHGIRFMRDYGWNKQNLYNFMYCDSPSLNKNVSQQNGGVPRFLYVGRFDYRMRGVDIIMKAFTELPGKWSLDLVGGYGENCDEVIQWAENTDQVTYLGRWPSNEVAERMKNYDVYICASKEDSWNGQTNLALSSGLSVITTNEAGSDELVSASNAGLVLPAGNDISLRKAIESIIRDPSVMIQWKNNAVAYANRITPECVANYFSNVLEKKYYHLNKDDNCPWV